MLFPGYYGGLLDEIIMRITDIFLAIPDALAMVIVAALGASTTNLIISLSLSQSLPLQGLSGALFLQSGK